jgi:tetratricopeptide (TPR) repeat protein
MCNQLLFPKEQILFGQNIPVPVNALLQQAVNAYDDTERAESLLREAQRMNPEQLEVYIALYKFYFYKLRLEEAESVARDALTRAAGQGGFDTDWRQLTHTSTDWSQCDGPARVYLYSLKALGFIRMRRMDFAGGEAILDKLAELDPQDQVGGSVLRELAAGLREVTDAVA